MLFFLIFLGLMATASAKAGRCNEGDQDAHFDSNKFWKCEGGRWIVVTCQINYFYDATTGFCYLSRFPTTRPYPPPFPTRPRPTQGHRCYPGTRIPYPHDHTMFLECSTDGTEYIKRYCQPDAVFVQRENMCVAIQTTYRPTRTWPTTTTTPYYGACKESAGHDGYKPDVYNCKNFYQCASGLWTQRSCGEGTIWDQHKLTCDHNRGQCRPTSPTVQPTYQPTWRPTAYPPNEVKK
ncbi:Chitin-binding type-2 domain-containing protein [Caenorhabditis elegans]|uniref:Chitin-binding type-2 domain-containing protein n=2 Tax=Caenorhabditis elegans TaxID=6239 RepID=O01780_CAEEL|nr:Chitin-binding type-2 domain-containing protein [Caenorhabditis elegans]CCD69309.1 Chitin-binding type-2 domain-containing protein [Caenorhabditis elegans]|eukprot:NP_490942.1 Uterine Lumin Expressed/locailized [Caenorhabditis elegans]